MLCDDAVNAQRLEAGEGLNSVLRVPHGIQIHMSSSATAVVVTGELDCRSCARARMPSWFVSESRRVSARWFLAGYRLSVFSNNI